MAQYTSCVPANQFIGPAHPWAPALYGVIYGLIGAAAGAVIGLFLSALLVAAGAGPWAVPVAAALIAGFIAYGAFYGIADGICSRWLDGRLICLDDEVCAIGQITQDPLPPGISFID